MWEICNFHRIHFAERLKLILEEIILCRAYQFAGEDGCLTKKNFIKILRSSDLFMKSFDKNKDGVVTEVNKKVKIVFQVFSIISRILQLQILS